jgi:PadR family transcriptional regulator PadR
MAVKSKKPASRGFVNNIILESLLPGDKYGYEIIKEVEEKSNGKIVLKQPSLYSSLKRFETKGFITSYWGDSDIGGRRHYYTITELGRTFFKSQNKNKNLNIDENDDEDDDSLSNNVTIDEIITNDEKEKLNSLNSDTKNKKTNENSDYDIFEVLNEKQKSEPAKTNSPALKDNNESAIQFDMFNKEEIKNIDLNVQEINTQKINEVKTQDQETNDINQLSDKKLNKKLNIPLIKEKDHNYLNWDDNKRKLVWESKKEQNTTEVKAEKQEPKKVVVDEFGILKNLDENIQKPKQNVIDNVVSRIDIVDPITNLKKLKEEKVEKIESETKNNFEKQDETIKNKIEKVSNKKLDSIDYKNILGDLLATDSDIRNKSQAKPSLTKKEDILISNEILKPIIQKIKTNSYTALDDALSKEGYKFKPYQNEIGEVITAQ